MLFLLIDLSDVHLDDDEKENISPDDLPAFVTIDTFGESFEEAVSIIFMYIYYVTSSMSGQDKPNLTL